MIMVPRPLPSVLIIHTGGTLGMDPVASFEPDVDGREKLKRGGSFKGTLGPGERCPTIYKGLMLVSSNQTFCNQSCAHVM